MENAFMRKTLVIISLLVLVSGGPLWSQNSVWNIRTADNQPYTQVALYALSNDTLIVQSMGNLFSIPVSSIQNVSKVESKFGVTLGGIVLGFIAGGLIGANSVDDVDEDDPYAGFAAGPVVAAKIGGLILGGLLGSVVGGVLFHTLADDSYDLRYDTLERRKEILRKLLPAPPRLKPEKNLPVTETPWYEQ